MFNFRNGQRRIEKVEDICERVARGVFKRIDENRELLELLKQEAPELMQRCPWVEGWIEGQDEFLVQLAQAVGTENRLAMTAQNYPRRWPGKRLEEERSAVSF